MKHKLDKIVKIHPQIYIHQQYAHTNSNDIQFVVIAWRLDQHYEQTPPQAMGHPIFTNGTSVIPIELK